MRSCSGWPTAAASTCSPTTSGARYGTIFAEFEGSSTLEPITTIPHGGTGDVKYHHGAEGSYQLPERRVDHRAPGVQPEPPRVRRAGRLRARPAPRRRRARGRTRTSDTERARSRSFIHGDAAFPGQGVVAETLNLQALDGYTVGGTIHIIANNQIGFTTDPEDSRSTRGPRTSPRASTSRSSTSTPTTSSACIAAVRLAFAFRQEFGHDVLIDLIGYRRFGHNEADEPAYTQPEMYPQIRKHPPRARALRRAADRRRASSPSRSRPT